MKSKDDLHKQSQNTIDNGIETAHEATNDVSGAVDTPIVHARNKVKQDSTDVKNKNRINHALMKANQMSSKVRIKAHQVLAGNRKK